MSLPAFPAFPLLGLRIRQAPGWKTVVEESAGGREYRGSYWTAKRRRFVLSFDALRDAVVDGSGKGEVRQLLDFIDQVHGSLYAFTIPSPNPWEALPVAVRFVNDSNELQRILSGYWSGQLEVIEVLGES